MKLAVVLAVLASSAPALGAGWNDFTLEIAPGFSVLKTSGWDVCLLGPSLSICPNEKVGPLEEYAVTDNAVYTRHSGSRSHPQQPRLRSRDKTVEYYYRVDRESGVSVGPVRAEHLALLDFPTVSHLDWTRPANPNVLMPLVGTLLALGFAAVAFKWPAALLLALCAGMAAWRLRRRRVAV